MQIKVNDSQLTQRVTSMRNAGNQVNPSTSSVPCVEKSSGIMISEYRDRILKISVLMRRYITLLNRDLADLNNAKRTVVLKDNQIGTDYNK